MPIAGGSSRATPKSTAGRQCGKIPATSPESDALSKDLKRRRFSFVGSTIVYAYMQAVGMVNDHLVDCFRYREIRQLDSVHRGRAPSAEQEAHGTDPSVIHSGNFGDGAQGTHEPVRG